MQTNPQVRRFSQLTFKKLLLKYNQHYWRNLYTFGTHIQSFCIIGDTPHCFWRSNKICANPLRGMSLFFFLHGHLKVLLNFVCYAQVSVCKQLKSISEIWNFLLIFTWMFQSSILLIGAFINWKWKVRNAFYFKFMNMSFYNFCSFANNHLKFNVESTLNIILLTHVILWMCHVLD
jgi:hypothetical protein